MESTPKRIKIPEPPSIPTSNDDEQSMEDEGEDIISSMPESIIGFILSKLPTKCAIGTAVLSTKWRYLFSSIPNPIIEISDVEHYVPPIANQSLINPRFMNPSFINFVSHLFNHILPQFSVIEELSLTFYDNYGKQRIEEWVSTAPPCNIRCLHLYSYGRDSGISSFDVFRPFKSLCRLDLYFPRCNFDAPRSTLLFPNLTWLSLTGFVFVGSNSFAGALAAFPRLTRLHLLRCRFPADACISVPSLRNLLLSGCYRDRLVLTIDTPALESLYYDDDYVGQNYPILISANFRALTAATFHVSSNVRLVVNGEASQLVYTQSVAKLLAACSRVRSLEFSVSNLALDHEAKFPMPAFPNLTNLELGMFGIVGWEILAIFLQSSPLLRVLTVFQEVYCYHVERYERFQRRLPGFAPICLSSHLSELVFQDFKGEKDEIKLVQYFLRTARVLEKMKICYLDSLSHEEVLEMKKDILTSPMCSTNCQIDIVMLVEEE